MLSTPVLLLVFNRPLQTMKVFEQIRLQRPQRLFIAADGPRAGKPGEEALCTETRDRLLAGIDWPCELQTLFRPANLGCGKNVSSAIDWFFSQVEEGIILEDDCLPDPTFFTFCTAMLQRYRNNSSIMHINGSNFQAGIQRGNASYYFSRYSHVWGWASWRRAWQHYDFTLQAYRHAPLNGLNRWLLSEIETMRSKKSDTWDIQWFMSVWFNHGVAITPNTSLVRNIGYGKEATHTKRIPGWFRKMVYGAVTDIIHPQALVIDAEADHYTASKVFYTNRLTIRIKKIVKGSTLLYGLYKRIS